MPSGLFSMQHEMEWKMSLNEEGESEVLSETPWIVLSTTYDVEMWIEHQNRRLQKYAESSRPERCGLRFRLDQGGSFYLHSMQDGTLILDLSDEAAWITPLLVAATHVAPPQGMRWQLPGECLVQLVLGLSPLLAATAFVTDHDYGIRRW